MPRSLPGQVVALGGILLLALPVTAIFYTSHAPMPSSMRRGALQSAQGEPAMGSPPFHGQPQIIRKGEAPVAGTAGAQRGGGAISMGFQGHRSVSCDADHPTVHMTHTSCTRGAVLITRSWPCSPLRVVPLLVAC